MPKPRNVLLVGWDGAAWKHVQPLLDGGALPNLSKLVERGVMGDVAPLNPPVPPMLWTSVSTGLLPHRHGVLDGVEDDPRTGGVRPVTRQSLAAPHVWELLAAEGVACQSVGWPVTHPAGAGASGDGDYTCVSDRFAVGAEASVWPRERDVELAGLRFSAGEWTGADLQLFVPELGKIDQDKDRRLAKLAVALAETATNHAVATALLEGQDRGLTAVWYGAVARAVELFPESSEQVADSVYAEAVSGVYRFLDLLLGRLLELAGPEAMVIVVSDRSAGEPEFHAESGTASQGILCAGGPGIAADELMYEPGVLDIAPTLLALFGFQKPAEMPGYVIEELCPEVPTRRLSGQVAAASQVHQAEQADEDAAGMDIDLDELEAAGYQDTVAARRRPEAVEAWVRRSLTLARVVWSEGRVAEAVRLLESVVPVISTHGLAKYADARLYLATLYLETGRAADARSMAEELLRTEPDSPLAAIASAHLAMLSGDVQAARVSLGESRVETGVSPAMDVALGNALLRSEQWDEAAAAFQSALAVDRRMMGARSGLALALLGTQRYEEAAEAALEALRLQHRQPAMHDALGKALRAMGRDDAANSAFAVRDSIEPAAAAPMTTG